MIPSPTVGFLGPRGTYTEHAAQQAVANATLRDYTTIADVFTAVACGDVDYGVVPYENALHGLVEDTVDALHEYGDRVAIERMLTIDINHAIGAWVAQPTTINRILSKAQALKQCSVYLDLHYPHAARIPTDSTAAAMQQIATHRWDDAAAIGAPWAFATYGLHVLAHHIGNSLQNSTQFAVIACKRQR